MLSKQDLAILRHDRQIPRYTSYPTAPHFNSSINSEIYTSWLKSLPADETLSLYFHIPFCRQLCWYCGCFTKITRHYAPIEDYANILAREIRLVSDLLKARKVCHLHFGGGSPTILLPETFRHLMQIIRAKFEIEKDAEIAIEIDPRNVSEEKISCYAKEGINRASIGVQDFNHETQLAINRKQSFELVYDCVKLLRKYGIEQINLDLIYGLPKQTFTTIKKSVNYSLLLDPSRISLFSYAHVPWIKRHMRLIDKNDLPSNLEKITMFKTATQELQNGNYLLIGLDHFVRKDDEMLLAFQNKKLKRNFQGYTTDKASSLIGFGASSISFLPFGYVQNTSGISEYRADILNKKLPAIKGIAISDEDKIRKRIID